MIMHDSAVAYYSLHLVHIALDRFGLLDGVVLLYPDCFEKDSEGSQVLKFCKLARRVK